MFIQLSHVTLMHSTEFKKDNGTEAVLTSKRACCFFWSVTTTPFITEATSYTLKAKINFTSMEIKSSILCSGMSSCSHTVSVLHEMLDKLQ